MRLNPRILLFFCALSLFCLKIEGIGCPSFKIQATSNQKKDVAYIVNTLAQHSSFSLLKYKNDLEEAGDRVRSVPPFVFFAIVLTNGSTKANLKKLSQKRGTPYKRFCSGFTKEFQNEATKPCFDKTFDGFCKSTKLDTKKMKPIFLKCYKNSIQRSSGAPFTPFIEAIAQ